MNQNEIERESLINPRTIDLVKKNFLRPNAI